VHEYSLDLVIGVVADQNQIYVLIYCYLCKESVTLLSAGFLQRYLAVRGDFGDFPMPN
jgi:hypothetical protein